MVNIFKCGCLVFKDYFLVSLSPHFDERMNGINDISIYWLLDAVFFHPIT